MNNLQTEYVVRLNIVDADPEVSDICTELKIALDCMRETPYPTTLELYIFEEDGDFRAVVDLPFEGNGCGIVLHLT